MGPSQRSQFMVLTEITAASVDENVLTRQTHLSLYLHTACQVQTILFYQISFRFLFPSLFWVQCSDSCLQGRSPDSLPKQQLVIEPKLHCLQYFQSKKTINFMSSPSFPMVQQIGSKMHEKKLVLQICILFHILLDNEKLLDCLGLLINFILSRRLQTLLSAFSQSVILISVHTSLGLFPVCWLHVKYSLLKWQKH